MNSMSKGYYNDDCDHCKKEKRHDDDDCCKKEKKPCPTILKCSSPTSVSISNATPANTTFNLSSLTLNTSCLCDPCTKLEFASNLVTAGYTGTVHFQVSKLCRGQISPINVGPLWAFSAAAPISQSQTFTFFVCDCDSCFDDCCTYTVAATAVTTGAGTLNILNATIGTISTCGGNKCC